jgi:membrane protease YdiL (CAAX protease family)
MSAEIEIWLPQQRSEPLRTSPPTGGPSSEGQQLEQAAVALEAGHKAVARLLLEQVLQADPRSERGWLWLAEAVEADAQRRFCLERVLSNNHRNVLARRALASLGPGPLESPLLPVARAALDVGRRAEARRLLEDALRTAPRSERSWLLLCDAVDAEEEQRFCLEQVLAINRRNGLARRELEVLGPGPARSPLDGGATKVGDETGIVAEPVARLQALPAAALAPAAAVPTGVVTPVATARRISLPPLPLAGGYLVAMAVAEVLTALIEPRVGLVLHSVLLATLLVNTALIWRHPGHRLLLSLSFAPLIRLLSLSMPLAGFPRVYWYFIISVPLFVATLVGLRTLGFSRQEVGLTAKALPLQAVVGLTGLSLGYVEYYILKPSPLAQTLAWGDLWLPGLILLLSTGFVEELIFRGMMQQAVTKALGVVWGVTYVAALFAVLHVGHLSFLDVAFVFVVALFFGMVKAHTGSIVGVTLAHGLTNILLFLTLPLGVNHFDLIFSYLRGR